MKRRNALGALDLKLREQMQVELKALQRRLQITFIFVTHDQGEALSLSDRVAVFGAGRIMQVGPPEEIYEYPRSRFVADFVGSATILDRALVARLGGPAADCALRPEAVTVLPYQAAGAGDGRLSLAATVVDVQYQGAARRLVLDHAGIRLAAAVAAQDGPRFTIGAAVIARFDRAALRPLTDEVT